MQIIINQSQIRQQQKGFLQPGQNQFPLVEKLSQNKQTSFKETATRQGNNSNINQLYLRWVYRYASVSCSKRLLKWKTTLFLSVCHICLWSSFDWLFRIHLGMTFSGNNGNRTGCLLPFMTFLHPLLDWASHPESTASSIRKPSSHMQRPDAWGHSTRSRSSSMSRCSSS